jgi:histidinol-phosphate aminotransferase
LARPLTDLVSPQLAGLVPYVPGKPIEEVERELGIADSVKLASNENPLGPSPKAVAAIQAALRGVHRYPDGGGHALRHALARHWAVAPDQVILGNGSNELLELVGRCFLLPGDPVVYAAQSFVVYDMVAQFTGAGKVVVPLRDFRHDLPAMRRAVTEATKLVFVANPSNPTGTAVAPEALEDFLAGLPPDVVAVLDEAYYEYLPPEARPDALRFVREGRPVLVLRTFSKVYGLAGLRLGYGIGPEPLVALLNRLRAPFNTNSLAQAAGLAALEDEAHVARALAVNAAGRKLLTERCEALGLGVVPSVTNFLLVDVRRPGAAVAQALLRRGIIVRPVANYGFPAHVRITVGTPAENERCLTALAAVLAEVPAA